MKLSGKKKDSRPATRLDQRGHGIFFYQWPAVLGSALLLAALAFSALQMLQAGAVAQAKRDMDSAARSYASQVATEVGTRRHLLRLLAAQDDVIQVLLEGDDEQLQHKARAIEPLVPELLQLRLLPAGWNRTDPGGKAPLGYAGVKLAEQAVASGKLPPAEVHQLNSPKPYIALVQPVSHNGERIGALHAAFSVGMFRYILDGLGKLPGGLLLEQITSKGGGFRLLASDEVDEAGLTGGLVKVDGTIWQVRHSVTGQPLLVSGAYVFLAISGLVLLVLIAVMFVQSRWLARHLAKDLDSVVATAKSMLFNSPMPDVDPHLTAADLAYQRLIQKPEEEPEVKLSLGERQVKPERPAKVPQDEREDTSSQDVEVPAEVFRAYDIRGVAGRELTPGFARLLGQAFAAEMAQNKGRKVVVGRDNRHSSPELSEALGEGLLMGGAQVIDLGEVPTPLVYFGTHVLHADASIVVTASHNPSEYNGFKLMLKGMPVSEGALRALRDRMVDGTLAVGSGERLSRDVVPSYLSKIQDDVHLGRSMKVVVDGGHGVSGPLAVSLLTSLGCEVIPLYCEPDGDFPEKVPDPSQPDHLKVLADTVKREGADLGFAFDGDGDRVGLVDNEGLYHWPDKLLMLLASDILIRHPGADVIYDVKCTRHLSSYILSLGGRPQMCSSGHSRMKQKMRETGADIGGELSGHLFIKDRWYGFDDGLYGAARVLEILSMDGRPVAEVMRELPGGMATPEYQVLLDSMAQARQVMESIRSNFSFAGAELIEIDGLRAEYPDGWGLIRQSNTMPALSLRFEADTEEALDRIETIFREQLQLLMPELKLPF